MPALPAKVSRWHITDVNLQAPKYVHTELLDVLTEVNWASNQTTLAANVLHWALYGDDQDPGTLPAVERTALGALGGRVCLHACLGVANVWLTQCTHVTFCCCCVWLRRSESPCKVAA